MAFHCNNRGFPNSHDRSNTHQQRQQQHLSHQLATNHQTQNGKHTQIDTRSMNPVPEIILALLQTTPTAAVEVTASQLTRRTRPVKIATTQHHQYHS